MRQCRLRLRAPAPAFLRWSGEPANELSDAKPVRTGARVADMLRSMAGDAMGWQRLEGPGPRHARGRASVMSLDAAWLELGAEARFSRGE